MTEGISSGRRYSAGLKATPENKEIMLAMFGPTAPRYALLLLRLALIAAQS